MLPEKSVVIDIVKNKYDIGDKDIDIKLIFDGELVNNGTDFISDQENVYYFGVVQQSYGQTFNMYLDGSIVNQAVYFYQCNLFDRISNVSGSNNYCSFYGYKITIVK